MENTQYNTDKLNPRTHQKKHPPGSGQLYPRDASMVQHMKLCQCIPTYKQIEKNMLISLDAEKAFNKKHYISS